MASLSTQLFEHILVYWYTQICVLRFERSTYRVDKTNRAVDSNGAVNSSVEVKLNGAVKSNGASGQVKLSGRSGAALLICPYDDLPTTTQKVGVSVSSGEVAWD